MMAIQKASNQLPGHGCVHKLLLEVTVCYSANAGLWTHTTYVHKRTAARRVTSSVHVDEKHYTACNAKYKE